LRKATPEVLGQDAVVFEPGRPGTRWLRVSRGGYGRGDLFFKARTLPRGPDPLLPQGQAGPAGHPRDRRRHRTLKTTYILDAAEPGINRVVWDLRFDPAPAVVTTMGQGLKRQIDQAMARTDLTRSRRPA